MLSHEHAHMKNSHMLSQHTAFRLTRSSQRPSSVSTLNPQGEVRSATSVTNLLTQSVSEGGGREQRRLRLNRPVSFKHFNLHSVCTSLTCEAQSQQQLLSHQVGPGEGGPGPPPSHIPQQSTHTACQINTMICFQSGKIILNQVTIDIHIKQDS